MAACAGDANFGVGLADGHFARISDTLIVLSVRCAKATRCSGGGSGGVGNSGFMEAYVRQLAPNVGGDGSFASNADSVRHGGGDANGD